MGSPGTIETPHIHFFLDFDGTIVKEDVGNAFFAAFGGDRAALAVEAYRTGAINARQCLTSEAADVGSMTETRLLQFADGFAVDPTFPLFVSYAAAIGADVIVLSDGLDVYVRRILSNAGLAHLETFANHAVFESGYLGVEFPFRDETCESCANCKRNHVTTLSADDDVVVYAGDGLSDRCAVPYADVVFARGSLVPFCQGKNITHHTFRDFADVKRRVARRLQDGTMTQRREPAMARRALFAAG